jgi:hypothetical protein
MPVYVPNYKYDIFVSYAYVDNQPLPNINHGWVTTLILSLKNLLAQKLGRLDAFSLWMNDQSPGNQAITQDIDERLTQSATLVFIASRGYLASHWCRLEFHTFLRQAGVDSGRLFMVELEMLPPEKTLPAFEALLGYRFWYRDDETGVVRTLGIPAPDYKTQPEYYIQLDKLATELVETLERLRAAAILTDNEHENLSRLEMRKKVRLEGEKHHIIQKINSLTRQYESISDSFQLPLSNKQRLALSHDLQQLEVEITSLEKQLPMIGLSVEEEAFVNDIIKKYHGMRQNRWDGVYSGNKFLLEKSDGRKPLSFRQRFNFIGKLGMIITVLSMLVIIGMFIWFQSDNGNNELVDKISFKIDFYNQEIVHNLSKDKLKNIRNKTKYDIEKLKYIKKDNLSLYHLYLRSLYIGIGNILLARTLILDENRKLHEKISLDQVKEVNKYSEIGESFLNEARQHYEEKIKADFLAYKREERLKAEGKIDKYDFLIQNAEYKIIAIALQLRAKYLLEKYLQQPQNGDKSLEKVKYLFEVMHTGYPYHVNLLSRYPVIVWACKHYKEVKGAEICAQVTY